MTLRMYYKCCATHWASRYHWWWPPQDHIYLVVAFARSAWFWGQLTDSISTQMYHWHFRPLHGWCYLCQQYASPQLPVFFSCLVKLGCLWYKNSLLVVLIYLSYSFDRVLIAFILTCLPYWSESWAAASWSLSPFSLNTCFNNTLDMHRLDNDILRLRLYSYNIRSPDRISIYDAMDAILFGIWHAHWQQHSDGVSF